MLWPELDLVERYQRAQLFFDAKDYRTAIELLVEVVAAEPTQQAPRLLARASFHAAQLRKAEEHLRVIIDREPTEAYAHLVLGRTLQGAGRGDEAQRYLRIAAAMMGDPSVAT